MENKKIIKIGFIVIGVFFAFAFVEASIRALAGLGNRLAEQKEEKKQEEVAYYSDKQTTQRQITTFLDNIFDAIKDKDYNYIFDSLDEVYQEYMFHGEVNQLKQYIDKNITLGEKREYIRISQSGGIYQVLVGITDGNDYFSQGYSVKVIDKNTCTLMFGEYTNLQKAKELAQYPDIAYQLKYYYETPDMMGYQLEIQNLASEEKKISFSEAVTLVLANGEVWQGNKPDAINIEANQKGEVELLFLKQTSGIAYLQMNVIENNESKNVMITFSEDIM